MSRQKHPHTDRVAEVYRPWKIGDAQLGTNLVWLGYTAEPIAEATWYPDLQAWVLPADHDWRPDMRWAPASSTSPQQ